MALGSHHVVFHTGEHTQFSLYGDIKLMSIFHHLLGECDILLVWESGTVDHYRREAEVDTTLAGFETVAMVEVQSNLRMLATQFLGIFHGTLSHILQQGLVGIVSCAFRHLQDNGASQVARSLDDGLELLHVVEVESGDGITAIDGTSEHILRVHKAQRFVIYHNLTIDL